MRVRGGWMSVVSLVSVVTACGRLSFDAQPGTGDATIDTAIACSSEHDEDGDGIDDCADVCPHVADPTQPDGDGDGVGDACDPGPGNHAVTLFAPMLAGTMPFTTHNGGTWTREADRWSYDGAGSTQLRVFMDVQEVTVWVGATIHARVGGSPQLAIALSPGGSAPHYYGELYEGSSPVVAVTYYDGADYNVLGETQTTEPSGDIVLQFQAVPGATATTTLEHDGILTIATGAATAYTGTPRIQAVIDDLDVSINYVAVIEPRP